ncbi:hypothetical protein V1264_022800 [Littorina saxatilis]|uniref:Uncharacterized protein n=1 Tax=Littorina saxatilis TaxID=31220 RepID=A0AAN9B6F2_9CAEN
MQDRTFPQAVMDTRAQLAEFNRFKMEDVPPRLETKQKLLRLFDELHSLTSDTSQLGIPEELAPQSLGRLWNRFTAAMQERDMAVQAEIVRQERLTRMAEKVHRECKFTEDGLADLERRIIDNEQRGHSLHPFEAKRNCEAMERAMQNLEETLKAMFRDVQTLQDNRFPQAQAFYNRASELQSRLSALRNHMYSSVVQPLLQKSYVEDTRTMTKRTEVHTEVRLVDTNPAFRHVQECLDWIEAQQQTLETQEYSSDLQQVQEQLHSHRKTHQEISTFRSQIDKCISDMKTLSSEEQKLYTQKLSNVEVAYSLLSNTSSRRLKCLEQLNDFLQAATVEMSWLSEREEVEVTRDWVKKDLNLADLDEHQKSLVRQLQARERHFNAVQEKGGAMILDRHPSSAVVEAYLGNLQSQWSWLLQLVSCLDTHLKHTVAYHQFFEEARHCEQWMSRHTELLQNRFARDNIPVEQAELLIRELQDVQEQLREYDRRVSTLALAASDIIPLPQRGQAVRSPVRVRAICLRYQPEVTIQKGEECFLVNNNQPIKWKVKTSTGMEAEVPSVCFIMPPPNQDATDYANRLKRQYDHLSALWKTQHRKLRYNTIFATINLIKGWDLKQFLSMGPAQREAVWRALKDDAEKLLAESASSPDRDSRKLRDELAECQRIFDRLSAEAAAREGQRSMTAAQQLTQQIDSVSRELGACDQHLSTLIHKPLPQNNLGVQDAFRKYREFQERFEGQEKEVTSLQRSSQQLSPPSQQVESKLNLVVHKVTQIRTVSHVYIERLKSSEVIISSLDDVKQLVSDYEHTLASQDNMTSDLATLRSTQRDLRDLQTSMQQQQPRMDHVSRDIINLRGLVEKSRPGTARHHDLEAAEKEVSDLNGRWDKVKAELTSRLQAVASSQDLLSLYQNGMESEEKWCVKTQQLVATQPPLNGDVTDAKNQLQPTMAIQNQLAERKHQIEAVNRTGGQYIREAKIYDRCVQKYQEGVSSYNTGSLKRPKRGSGAENVKNDLDSLNRRHMEMVKWTNERLKQIKATLAAANYDVQFQMGVTEEVPLLRTFRAELAKRSSVLVDEDMHEYFTQLNEFEGYGSQPGSYSGTPGQNYVSQMTIRPETTPATEQVLPEQTFRISLMGSGQPQRATVGTTALSQLSTALKAMQQQPVEISSTRTQQTAQVSVTPDHQQTVITVTPTNVSQRGQVLNVAAVLNPVTNEKLTLVEALHAGIIDPQTQSVFDPRTRQKLSLAQAAKKGLVDEVLHRQLTSPCGLRDPATGRELSLIEAIQQELYDPDTNRIKDSKTGEMVPVSEALSRDIISESCSRVLSGDSVNLTSITHSQARFANSEPLSPETALSLGQAVEKGLYNAQTGRLTDPLTGANLTLLQAVEKGYINPSYREVIDPTTGHFVTLTEAVNSGTIDPERGVFSQSTTGQSMSLDEAVRQGMVRKPTSLADLVKSGGLAEGGRVFDSSTGQMLSFRDAVDSGVVDKDKKCILDQASNEALSVAEAMKRGLMTPQGTFVDPVTGRQLSVFDALESGTVKLVSEDVSFSKPAVRDTRANENVTVAEALKRGIIKPSGRFVDKRTGREMSLQQAVDQGLIDPATADELTRLTSVTDESGRAVSFLQAVQKGLIDPQQGLLKNAKTGSSMTLQEASTQGLVSADDAVNLLGLISPVMTSTTILTQIQPSSQEAVTVTSITITEATTRGLLDERTGYFTDPTTGRTMLVEDAIQKGLLTLSSQWPGPAALTVDVEEPDRGQMTMTASESFITDMSGGTKKTIPIEPGSKKFESGFMSKTDGNQFAFTTTTLAKPLQSHSVINEVRHITIQSVKDPKTGKEISSDEAIRRGLVDLSQGLYCNTVTGEKIPFNQAIERGYIKAVSGGAGGDPVKETRAFSITGVIHPRTGAKLTVSQAIQEGILDQEKGIYYGLDELDRFKAMPISEAIEKGFVIAEDLSTSVSGPASYVRETKTFILKGVIHPVTKKRMTLPEAIAAGVVNESEGLYVNPRTGESMPIHEAIQKGLMIAELSSVSAETDVDVNKITTTKLTTLSVTAVIDPRTNKIISVTKAIADGILDQSRGLYINPQTGESMALSDAIDKRLILAESAEAMSDDPLERAEISSIHIQDETEAFEAALMEDLSTETVTLSIQSVIDPRTMEMVSYDKAVGAGILNVRAGSYVNPLTRETMTITAAMEKGLIHGEVTSKTREEELMKSVVSAENVGFPTATITSVKDPMTGKEISLSKAIQEGIINKDNGTYIDKRTGREVDLHEALEKGLITQSKTSDAADLDKSMAEEEAYEARLQTPRSPHDPNKPWSKVDMEVEKTVVMDEPSLSPMSTEVLHYSTDMETKSDRGETFGAPAGPQGLSYEEALRLGVVNSQTGTVRDPGTGTVVSLDKAIAAGIIDVDKPAVTDPTTQQSLSLHECMERQLVNPVTGKLDPSKAESQGFSGIKDTKQVLPMNLIDAVAAGLFDSNTAKFLEPKSGQQYSLQSALNNNIIDGSLVTVKTTARGERVPLKQAVRKGLIDGRTAKVLDKKNNRWVSLPEAIQLGLVQNALDEDSGSMTDPHSGQQVSLSQAISSGALPADNLNVVDTRTGEQVTMDVAYRRGLVDRAGNVQDKMTGQKTSAQDALKMGLLAIVGAPVLAGKMVVDAIQSRTDVTDAATGSKVSPSVRSSTSRENTPTDKPAVAAKPLTTIVYARPGDQITPTPPKIQVEEHIEVTSIKRGPLNVTFPNNQETVSTVTQRQVTDVNGGSQMAKTPGRLADSYDNMLQELSSEQEKLADYERILKKDSQMGDEAYKVKAQLESHKGVHEEIVSQQQPILSLMYKAEQLTENYQEELTPEQVTELTSQSAILKSALEKVSKTSERRLAHLNKASEELSKLEEEMGKFKQWMSSANKELTRQEECLQRFEDLKPLADKQKALSSDVVSHQADLRFMSMASQKYMEEAKLYKLEIDSFRADRVRPARQSLISMECVAADDVKDRLKDITDDYHDLGTRCNSLGDRLADLSGKHRQFNDSAFKLLDWLTETEGQLATLKHEAGSPEPAQLQAQLDRLKSLSMDSLSQRGLLDDMQRRGQDLTNSLSGQATDKKEVAKLKDTMDDISARYTALTNDISARTTGLQTAITQSQDVTQAMDGLLNWLDSAEQAIVSQTPVSLQRPVLNTQLQGISVVQADITNHQSALEAIRASANELVKTCDLDIAKAVEQRLAEVEKKFATVQSRSKKRNRDLDDIDQGLRDFKDKVELSSNWVQGGIQKLDSKDLAKLPSEDMSDELDKLAAEKKQQEKKLAELKVVADRLINDPRTGDTTAVQEAVAELERNLAAFDSLLAAKHQEADVKEQQGNAFESAKTLALLWLSQMEARLDEVEPVAIEVDMVEQQIAQLQPMLQEYEDYAPKVDEVNDLGNSYEAMVNPNERPMSPIRRMGRSRRLPGILSPRLGTPSPTFPSSPSAHRHSPLSSESSGISSRKSSADNLLLDDLSETQQQLLDINQRYEIVGERLADRQQELQLMLTSIRTFLTDLHDVLHWLDTMVKETATDQMLPTNEKDAKKQLKQHEAVHRELLSKEGLVEDIRKKAQELLKTRHGVPGGEGLQQQLSELDDKWHNLRATSEHRRKKLEDMVSDLRDLREHEEQLMRWLGQKERMLDVLGPVAMEPAMLASQLEQVKVLKEEVAAQEPIYDQFLNCGHAILDRCDPASHDGKAISRKLDSVSKAWNRLQSRIDDRSKSLTSVEGISSEFSGLTRDLANWMSEFNDRLDGLGRVSNQPDIQEEQLQQLQDLEAELEDQQQRMKKARDLCKQLCDKTKDPSTKADLRSKLAALEKDLNDTTKKLDARRSAVEAASKEAAKFKADCHDLLGWVNSATDRLDDAEAISSDPDTLKLQARQNRALQQEISLKEPDVKELLEKGNQLVQDSSPSAEVRAIEDTLGEIKGEWERVKKAADEREQKLSAADSHAQHFHEHLDKMNMWLNMTEEKLDNMKTGDVDKKDVDQTLRELQGVETDLQKKGHTLERLEQDGRSLMDSVDSGQDDIHSQVNAVKERFDTIKNDMTDRSANLEDLSQRLAEIQDTLAEGNSALTKWEDKLAAHNTLGSAAKDPKYVDKIKDLLEDCGWLEECLGTADRLMDSVEADGGNTADLRAERDKLAKRHQALQGELSELVATMETGAEIVEQFQGLLKTVGGQLSELESELDTKSPVSRDDAELDNQNADIKDFLDRLDDKIDHLNDLQSQADDLGRAGYVSDPQALKSHVEALHKQHAALKAKAEQRQKEIASGQKGLEELTQALNAVQQGFTKATTDMDSMDPIAGEVGAIKAMQEQLKGFVKSTVEPLQKKFDAVTSQGQALIKSAPPGSNTSGLETDLESLSDRWADLSAKVSEREKNLDSAMLQSGKFQEAMASLLTWLAETEETVANQKTPSPEHRVVKAQLQEQKLVQKMVTDRAPNVQAVKVAGSELLKGKDAKERNKIEAELKQVNQRWDALTTKVSDRTVALEEVQGLAGQFTEILDPLTVWLDNSDKRFAALEPQSADAEGIEKLIEELKNLEEEISEREPSVRQLATTGKDLQGFCKGEDVIMVQMKIDDAQRRFGELRSRVEDSLEQMEEALPLAHHFQDAHQGFLAWANKVEPELRAIEHTLPESEEAVEELLTQLEEVQALLDTINSEGAELTEVTPGDASLRVEDLIHKDNKRFDNLKDLIEKRAEKAKLAREKSTEVVGELSDLLDWFNEAEDKLKNPSPVTANPETLQTQLAQQKGMNEDVSAQKGKARDALSAGKKLLNDHSLDDEAEVRTKMDQLKQKADSVSVTANERLSTLEQALPLARHFREAHGDLVRWLDEVEPAIDLLDTPSVDAEQVKKQQEKAKALKQEVQDQKPALDRLNKTGAVLASLCDPQGANEVNAMLDDDNRRMDEVRTHIRDRSNSIDLAMQQSAEFSDKLEVMLDSLTDTAEQVRNAEPISAHPDKLKDQIDDNKGVEEDLEMRQAALDSVKMAAEELLKQAGTEQDEAVKDVRQKLDELTRLFKDIQDMSRGRARALDDTLGVSEKFWDDLNNLNSSLKDLQDQLHTADKPALEPEAIREQQEELEALKEDMEASQADLEDVQQTGEQLMGMVGGTEQPEVQKTMEDAGASLAAINDSYNKRQQLLENALAKATHFQDHLMKLLVWLQGAEEEFANFHPVAAEFEIIKKQWEELKVFKAGVDPKHIEVESLNQQGSELTKDSTPEQAAVLKEPLTQLNVRWGTLLNNIGDRQRELQMALLTAGQFDHAYKELRHWMDSVNTTLDEVEPVCGDPQVVEIELAKLRIVQNDIAAHQESVDSIGEEAQRLMGLESGAEVQRLKAKMEDMNQLGDDIHNKSRQQQDKLEDALREAQGFTGELQDVMMKINDLESQLITSKPVGGMPETAREQLEKFMEVYGALERLEPDVESLTAMGEKLSGKSSGPALANIKQNLANLHQRWDHVRNRATDRKKKLEDAVDMAGNFHGELNKFIAWLTETEKTLNNLQPVSRLVDSVTSQIEDHKVLQKDISGHREAMVALDKMGTHLKYFSQKQDVVLIKNLLSSVQHRWEKIVSRSAERTRHLERGYKEAKQFQDTWKDLIVWLVEAEKALESETTIGNDPDKIKAQIMKHKEFQRRLGGKQPVYDGVNKAGRTLKDRCPGDDVPTIQAMLTELKSRWNSVCGKSVDRQRKLEEGLLLSGQFNEALDALLEWLARVEPTLSDDSPVHGDLDTVNSFLDTHKAFQTELGARAGTIEFVQKSAKELISKAEGDTSNLQSDLIELSSAWDRVCKLSVSKQDRLEQAQKLAEEFHKKSQQLLDWLADAERQLRYKGSIPDDETQIQTQIDDHKKFEENLMRQEANLRETLNIGQDIMKRCHPDAVPVMKQWLSVLRARWEELSGLCKQRNQRLTGGLADLRNSNVLLEELLAWLNGAEVTLTDREQQPIPEDMTVIQDLLKEHQDFQNEMSSRQPDVDRLIKADKRRTSTSGHEASSQIPVLRSSTPLTPSRKIPVRVGASGRTTPDRFGRHTPEHFGRRTPDISGRQTPDHGSGRRTPEPQFRNPRVGALFNRWRNVWLMAMERQRRLQDALDNLNELERLKNFEFDEWRKRYLRWMNHNKSRIMDFFRRQDRDRDGRVTRKEFIDGIISSRFQTSKLEMEKVANIFDKDGDGFINYKEFVSALRPDRDVQPVSPEEMIHDEVRRQVCKCTCVKQFKIHKIGEGKYRFGDSQKLRLVRILRSTVMVRVGGGWVALDEFLVKNDPCRVGLWRRKFRLKRRILMQQQEPEFEERRLYFCQHCVEISCPIHSPSAVAAAAAQTKGRTNVELRENFILAAGVSQSMAGFVSKSPGGSSHSGSSTYSGTNNTPNSRSTGSGPITKIREKTAHSTPWRQQRAKTSPDGEVTQIMSKTDTDGLKVTRTKTTRDMRSPRSVGSPRNISSPASLSSSRAGSAGTGSRPTSRTGSEAGSDDRDPEVYTTMQAQKRTVGGRNDTTLTYQTHRVETRTVTMPTATHTKISRIPKASPAKPKK